MTSTAVRVALRIRPLTQKEQLNNCTECLTLIPNEPQVLLGTDKSFTYDYVYGTGTHQNDVYTTAAAPLLDKFMEGFNATILAYGQTGSGKTFSMGTGLMNNTHPDDDGIVPRCIMQLFKDLQERTEKEPGFQYDVYVSFLELYNEELVDLLNPQSSQKRKGQPNNNNTNNNAGAEVSIREDVAGNIYWSGVKEEHCNSPEELLGYLAKGSLCRTTGATDMNTVSSRSHAVFSVFLRQQHPGEDGEIKSYSSKFHFVDLAGSERLKRTNAQGDRAKEGIAINSGLLALGNVISALGDEARRMSHVPYRDSKLTRLLQDSLGGNSQTLMLACVSPADTNFMETLNTLKYANRARNIKNRVTINQDFAGSSIEVNQLRAQIVRLRMEIASLRADGAMGTYGGSSTARDDETRALRSEVTRLRDRIQDLSTNLIQATSERDTLAMERELGQFLENDNDPEQSKAFETHPMVAQYQKTIQDLNNDLADTRDRLFFLESTKPIAMNALSMANGFETQSSVTFSQYESHTTSQQTRRRNKPRRRGRPGRISANTSHTTSGVVPVRVASSRRTHRVTMSQSSSFKTSKARSTAKDWQETTDGTQEIVETQRQVREEVQDSIAKAREEIRNGMQVLELIKPLDDTTFEWDEELKAFELEIERANGNQALESQALERTDSDQSSLLLMEQLAAELEADDPDIPSWEDHRHCRRASNTSDASRSSTLSAPQPPSAMSLAAAAQTASTADKQNPQCNPQLVRMFHQIQSDIRVKEELVSHLEKSENEYSFLRRKFDNKIEELQSQLMELQRERDEALTFARSNFGARSEAAQQMREKQQLIEIRQTYEKKTKNLLTEIQDLKRRYSQTTVNMQATRNQNESLLRSLRVNVETLKVEKKRMAKRMRQETERVREQMSMQVRKIQQLQRLNAEANLARKRLEREHEAQKQTLKRRNEEVSVNVSQLKQLTNVLKKAVREGGILDERLLGKVSHIVGGSFALIARGPRRSSGNQRRKRNKIPLQLRVERKKQLLDRALYQYIQGKQAIVEMEQLLFRRERLASEKAELVEERQQMYMLEQENADATGVLLDTTAIEFTDERIDLISAEISYLSARIRALQTEAAGVDAAAAVISNNTLIRPEKRVTFADEIVNDPPPSDEWADMDSLEEIYSVPPSAAPEMAFDVALKLLRSLEADESQSVAEALVEDITNVRLSECNRQVTMQNLEKTVQDLRRTLIVMKRAAIATTIENERRIRKLEDADSNTDKDSAIDVKIEDFINSGNTIFDKIYEDGLRGMISSPTPPGMDMSTMLQDLDHLSNPSSTRSSVIAGDALLSSLPMPPSPLITPVGTPSTRAPASTSSTSSITASSAPAVPRPPTMAGLKPPPLLCDMVNKRDLTPSPDRFLNMIQKRMSWQQRVGGSESPIPITMVSPTEFVRYATERDSSTSSIRSGHFRRSSVQSDFSSSQASAYSTASSSQGSLRKRSASLQQPLLHQRRRASLRELSLLGGGIGGVPMISLPSNGSSSDYDGPYTPKQSASICPQRPASISHGKRLTPQMSLASLSSAVDRAPTPLSHNVFERLSQTPTRASRAKASYRHSSSSMDELRQRWDPERAPSALSGAIYVEAPVK